MEKNEWFSSEKLIRIKIVDIAQGFSASFNLESNTMFVFQRHDQLDRDFVVVIKRINQLKGKRSGRIFPSVG